MVEIGSTAAMPSAWFDSSLCHRPAFMPEGSGGAIAAWVYEGEDQYKE